MPSRYDFNGIANFLNTTGGVGGNIIADGPNLVLDAQSNIQLNAPTTMSNVTISGNITAGRLITNDIEANVDTDPVNLFTDATGDLNIGNASGTIIANSQVRAPSYTGTGGLIAGFPSGLETQTIQASNDAATVNLFNDLVGGSILMGSGNTSQITLATSTLIQLQASTVTATNNLNVLGQARAATYTGTGGAIAVFPANIQTQTLQGDGTNPLVVSANGVGLSLNGGTALTAAGGTIGLTANLDGDIDLNVSGTGNINLNGPVSATGIANLTTIETNDIQAATDSAVANIYADATGIVNIGSTSGQVIAGNVVRAADFTGKTTNAALLSQGLETNTIAAQTMGATVSLYQNAGTINLGGTGSSVVIEGTTTFVNSTNLAVEDKDILLNRGGPTGTSVGGGFQVQDGTDTTSTSFVVNSSRTGYTGNAIAANSFFTLSANTGTPSTFPSQVRADSYTGTGGLIAKFPANIQTQLLQGDGTNPLTVSANGASLILNGGTSLGGTGDSVSFTANLNGDIDLNVSGTGNINLNGPVLSTGNIVTSGTVKAADFTSNINGPASFSQDIVTQNIQASTTGSNSNIYTTSTGTVQIGQTGTSVRIPGEIQTDRIESLGTGDLVIDGDANNLNLNASSDLNASANNVFIEARSAGGFIELLGRSAVIVSDVLVYGNASADIVPNFSALTTPVYRTSRKADTTGAGTLFSIATAPAAYQIHVRIVARGATVALTTTSVHSISWFVVNDGAGAQVGAAKLEDFNQGGTSRVINAVPDTINTNNVNITTNSAGNYAIEVTIIRV